jgi:hypothetical protein
MFRVVRLRTGGAWLCLVDAITEKRARARNGVTLRSRLPGNDQNEDNTSAASKNQGNYKVDSKRRRGP